MQVGYNQKYVGCTVYMIHRKLNAIVVDRSLLFVFFLYLSSVNRCRVVLCVGNEVRLSNNVYRVLIVSSFSC